MVEFDNYRKLFSPLAIQYVCFYKYKKYELCGMWFM